MKIQNSDAGSVKIQEGGISTLREQSVDLIQFREQANGDILVYFF